MTFISSHPTPTHIVYGASGALGRAVADHWAGQVGKARVMRLGRHADYGGIDALDEASVAAFARSIEDRSLEAVFVASGVLHTSHYGPEKISRNIDADIMTEVLRINSIAPMILAKYLLPKFRKNGRTTFAAIGARVGSISDNRLGGWYSYRASKAALHMLIRTLAVEWARKYPDLVCVALHPGTVDSDLSKPFQRGVSPEALFTPVYSAKAMLSVLDTLTPEQSGRIFAWDGQEIEP